MMDHLATTSGTQGPVMSESSYPPCKMARMENSVDLPVPGVTPVSSLIPVFCMVEQSDVPPSERKRSEHAEFVLLKKDLLFSQITEAALQELGYTHTAAALMLFNMLIWC
uniref:CMP domain-containing protein n=1 Tax=Sinocyclocheilus grahami TaxID=75366 RepID=A0A672KKI6_SINGR